MSGASDGLIRAGHAAKWWGCLCAGLTLLALLLSACGVRSAGSSGGGVTRQSTPTATPTATPATTLAWRQSTWPPGFSLQDGGLAVSPVDGHDVWTCAPAGNGVFAVWASRDAALTWARVGAATLTTPQWTRCALVADSDSTTTLVLVLTWGSGATGTLASASLISQDGGATWRALPGELDVVQVASVAGTIYAILYNTAPNAPPPSGLVVSTDGLRTWRVARPPNLATHDEIFQFWLNPTADDLVATSALHTLWRSTDGGVTWTRLPSLDMQASLGVWLPQRGQWLLCGGMPTAPQLVCTSNDGASWRQVPSVKSTASCAICGKNASTYTPYSDCAIDAIAPDQSFVSICSISDMGGTLTLFRLTPAASTWANLGTAPGGFLALSASGQLWCLDQQTLRLFVATLPA